MGGSVSLLHLIARFDQVLGQDRSGELFLQWNPAVNPALYH